MKKIFLILLLIPCFLKAQVAIDTVTFQYSFGNIKITVQRPVAVYSGNDSIYASNGNKMVLVSPLQLPTSTATQTALNLKQAAFTTSTITSGSSSTLSQSGAQIVYIDPASLLASYTITTPASPQNNDIIEIAAGGTIAASSTVVTTFTFTANSGQSLLQTITPTSLKGGDRIKYQYNLTQTKWQRIL